ncbi:MAG: hypothetical protein KDD32_03490 [Bacteroidetes bacterium]|nr:hypothetical protein [Bacteroidota bacterium]
MKTIAHLFITIAVVVSMSTISFAQEEKNQSPPYIVITQAHWNWDNVDGDQERWLELEQLWHKNVTEKNEYIMSSGVYHHYYTEDNSEVNFVTVYPTWEAIELAGQRSDELEKAAWPDEAERKAYNKERNSYYTTEHSDEIYVGLPFIKPVMDDAGESLVVLVRDRHLAFPEDGTNEEIAELMKEFHSNVTHKNPYLLGFYMHRHAWGSDGRDVQLVFVLKSMADIEKMQDEQGKLIEAYWPDEAKRKEFFKKMNKYLTPWHGDRIYQTEPSLGKSFTPPNEEELMDADEK